MVTLSKALAGSIKITKTFHSVAKMFDLSSNDLASVSAKLLLVIIWYLKMSSSLSSPLRCWVLWELSPPSSLNWRSATFSYVDCWGSEQRGTSEEQR